MASWGTDIISFTGAMQNATTSNVINMAEYVQTYQTLGSEALAPYWAEQGFTVLESASGSVPSLVEAVEVGTTGTLATETTLGASTLEAVTTAEGVQLKTLSATTTKAGTNLATGGASVMSKALPIIGAVVTGAGLGWDAYQSNPNFWADISDAIFSGGKNKNVFEVITRAIDGSPEYRTYLSMEDVARVIQASADQNAFWENYEETFPSGYQEGGSYVATGGGIHTALITRANSIYNSYALTHYPSEMSYSFIMPQEYMSQLLNAVNSVKDNYDWMVISGRNVVSAGYTQFDVTLYKVRITDNSFWFSPAPSISSLDRAEFHNSSALEYHNFWVRSSGHAAGFHDGGVKTTSYSYLGTYTNSPTVGTGEYSYIDYGISTLNYEIGDVTTGNSNMPKQDGAIVPYIAPNTSLADIMNMIIPQYFPNWVSDGFSIGKIDPATGEIIEVPYLPIHLPEINPDIFPRPTDYTQDIAQDGLLRPQTNPYQAEQLQNMPEIEEVPETISQPQPPIVLPIIPPFESVSNALFTAYNPDFSKISALGRVLWTDNVLTTLIRMFQNNPLDAIISLHRIYVRPSTGTDAEIILGTIPTNISAPKIVNQYTYLDCGTVSVREYFGDARDYSPYTTISIYLPFIGIVDLKTEDIIGSKVNVKYVIDSLTGTTLCNIYVTKNGRTQIMYTYNGDCSVQIPLTSADRTRLLSGVIAGGVTGGMKGGVIGAIAGGLAGGAMSGGVSVNRSGQFSGNAGAMGVKTPYLIISRKIPYDALNYNKYYGYPSNNTVLLNDCVGYTRVKEVKVDIERATDTEKTKILQLLQQGVIIN